VVAVMKDPAVAEAIRTKLQMDPIGSTASEAAKTFADDAKLWAGVIEQAHITLE